MEDLQRTSLPAPVPGPEIQEPGSRLTGILGALLGAIVGAVPWFLVSTFTHFYVGWLGFVIGWASAFGYRTLKGRRSYGFAMCFVVISSILALILANISTWVYLVCTDPELQATAAQYGLSPILMAFLSLLIPEIWKSLLPDLGMGLFIGILGLLSVGRYVRQYTDPAVAAEVDQELAEQAFERHCPDLPSPGQFTVRSPKYMLVLGIFTSAFFGGLAIAACIFDPGWIFLGFIPFLLLGLYLVLASVNTRLEVDGDHLTAKNSLGKAASFEARDIAGVSSVGQGAYVLRGQDGRKLFRLEQGMKNAPLLMQWLKEHDIPLRGK